MLVANVYLKMSDSNRIKIELKGCSDSTTHTQLIPPHLPHTLSLVQTPCFGQGAKQSY